MGAPESSNKESIENLIARSKSKSEETRAKIEALDTKIEASNKEISALIDASTKEMEARNEETQKEIDALGNHPYLNSTDAYCFQLQINGLQAKKEGLLVLMGVLTTLTAAYLAVKLYTPFIP